MGDLHITIDERVVTARIDAGDRVVIDERPFTVVAAAEGEYVVSDGTRRWRVVVAGGAADRWVFVSGRVARLEIAPRGRPAARTAGPGVLSAPMPATVVTVYVEPGSRVTKGDTLLMLEAMKMELPIRAPQDGIVRAIRCAAGQLVQPGVNLVEMQ